MKTIHYFLLVLIMLVSALSCTLLHFQVTMPVGQSLLPYATAFVFKWFIIIFNAAAIMFALPLFTGKRNAIAFYNQTAGNSVMWGMARGFCWAYQIIWLLYALIPLDLIAPFDLFNNNYDPIRGINTYELPFLGHYVITSHEWDLMFILVLFGILGLKASFLANTWGKTLMERELILTRGGTVLLND